MKAKEFAQNVDYFMIRSQKDRIWFLSTIHLLDSIKTIINTECFQDVQYIRKVVFTVQKTIQEKINLNISMTLEGVSKVTIEVGEFMICLEDCGYDGWQVHFNLALKNAIILDCKKKAA